MRDDAPTGAAEEARAMELRAVELRVLYDLALRLTTVHDVDELLQEVVDQARRLLDVDVSYLALLESDGRLVIRVTDGSIGPRLRGVTFEPHSGLGGLVIDLAEPVQTSDYLADGELRHEATLDSVAAAERLRTIAGVPLRLRGDVIGVLMVSQRDVRELTPSEMSFLTSLASLSAVALDNARLIDRYRRLASDLSAVNEQLREHARMTDRAAEVHDELLSMAAQGAGADRVLLSLSRVVSGTVTLLDERDQVRIAAREGELVAEAHARPIDGSGPSAVFARMRARSAERPTRWGGGTLTTPVGSADTYFGAVQVESSASFTDWDIRMVERCAIAIALVQSVEHAVAEADHRTTAEVVADVVTRGVDPDGSLTRRARNAAIDLRASMIVVVVNAPAERVTEAVLRLRDHTVELGGVAERVLGRVVALLPAPLDRVREVLHRRPMPGPVGLAGPATGVVELAAAHADAVACAAVLEVLDRADGCASPDELGPFRLLLSGAGRAEGARYVRATIGPLLDYDVERATDLGHTASAFLFSGRQHAATAATLNIHTNTLYQRLHRVSQLLGEGWRDGDRALEVQLALRLVQLMAELPALGNGHPT